MQTKFMTSQPQLPLSKVPAGKTFMVELGNSANVFMVLDASKSFTLDGDGEFVRDSIFYCCLEDGTFEKMEMFEAEETYVYIVRPVEKIIGFKC